MDLFSGNDCVFVHDVWSHFKEIWANFCTILEKNFLYLHFVAFVVSIIFLRPSAGLRWCVNSKRKMCFFMISLLDMVPRMCLSLVTSGTFSLAQNIFLTNQRPWRALKRSLRFAPVLLVYFCQKSEVTDIGPKDSNFPQNAWGLLDSTAWKSHFRCYTWELWSHYIPGNSDALRTQNVCTAEKKRRSKLKSWSCRCYSTVLLAQISDSVSHLSWVTCSAVSITNETRQEF